MLNLSDGKIGNPQCNSFKWFQVCRVCGVLKSLAHSVACTDECEKRRFKCTFANRFDVECKIEFHQLVVALQAHGKNFIHDSWHSTTMTVHNERKKKRWTIDREDGTFFQTLIHLMGLWLNEWWVLSFMLNSHFHCQSISISFQGII